MGSGIEMAKLASDNPELVQALDDMRDLLIAIIKELGGSFSIAVEKVDDTGNDLLAFGIDGTKEKPILSFEVRKKQ